MEQWRVCNLTNSLRSYLGLVPVMKKLFRSFFFLLLLLGIVCTKKDLH